MSLADRDTGMTPTRAETSSGRGFVIGGAICAVVALFLVPIIFGPAGAVLGFVGYAKGDRRGLWVGIGAIVATLVGMAFGAWVMSNR